jgi:hypothetical protein
MAGLPDDLSRHKALGPAEADFVEIEIGMLRLMWCNTPATVR